MKKFYKIFIAAVVFLLVTSAAFAGGSKEAGIKELTKKEKEAILELEKIKSKQLYSKIAGKYAVKEAVYKAFGRKYQI